MLDPDRPEASFTLRPGSWPDDDFPWTVDHAPIQLEARARRIPEWTLDRHGLCAVLQDSPVRSDEPEETVTLIPMGCARLRISAFPVIGDGPGAHTWNEPPRPRYRTTASHVHDDVGAPCDGVAPANSGDHAIPRFTWWDRRGTTEWLQYTFEAAREVSAVSVYWFDDTGVGQCRVPASWRVLCRKGQIWTPVQPEGAYGTERDRPNQVAFAPVRTDAVRLEVKLQDAYSGGVLEWLMNDEQRAASTGEVEDN